MILPATDENVMKAAKALCVGQLVVLPTETVYGLGANAEDDCAVAAIYQAKDRPAFNPLIVHVANIALAERYGELTAAARTLAEVFWPGPLTLVCKRRESALSHLATAGLDTVALRMPSHRVARALLNRLDFGVAAPSANRSGRISPTHAEHAEAELGNHAAMVLDGGPSEVGLESTVVDARRETLFLLRLGSVTAEAIHTRAGLAIAHVKNTTSAPRSPGMLLRHYAPKRPLRINATALKEGEALLAFGPAPEEMNPAHLFQLSETKSLNEAAANLFAMLRAADASACSGIAVMPIPDFGLGEAINDRLKRAAE